MLHFIEWMCGEHAPSIISFTLKRLRGKTLVFRTYVGMNDGQYLDCNGL